MERKRRTREHVLADLSANFVEKQALLCWFTVERVRLDYGIDLVMQTFSRHGEVESGRLFFQLKATDRLKHTANGSAVKCRIERADLLHWLEEAFPVVLVLYDAKADTAYWVYIQQHFGSLAGFAPEHCGERITVAIPRSNVLDRRAMRALARAKNAAAAILRGVWTHGV
jgi:hypothetical protein